MHSPFKNVLGKIGDKYQAHCAMYKTHTMATCHRGKGHPLAKDIDLSARDPEPTNTDNESTHSSDATVALGEPEAEDHPDDPIYSNQDKLMALMIEINDLCHQVEAGEGQPAGSLDHSE